MDRNLGELAEHMNITVVSVTEDMVILTMPVEGNRQPAGLMHGGANAALVEEAASLLAYERAPHGKIPVGTELNVSQLRGARSGNVTATATLLSQARSSICSQVEIRDDSGELTAVGRLTNVFVS